MILLWRISTKCNFGCAFCAYDRRLGFARRQADPAEVTRVVALFSNMAAQQQEKLHVSWLGGEPFLWSPLLAVSQDIAANPAIMLSATTNGSRLSAAHIRQQILSCFAELTISIDGPADIHDELRGAPGSFARIEKSVRLLVAERAQSGAALKIRVNAVMMRRTVPHLGRLCDILADWGVDEITFNQLGGRDRPEYFPDNGLRPDDVAYLRKIVPDLAAKLDSRGVLLCANDMYLDRLAASSRGERLSIDNCNPGKDFYLIDEDGIIAPCGFTAGDYGIAIADIQTTDDVQGLAGKFRKMQATARSTACDDCLSTQVFGKFAG